MENEYVIIQCPHCKDYITVYLKEYNCKIFRHGVYKNTLKQIDPHLSKLECDRLFNKKLIYGCGKPFQVLIENNQVIIKRCHYI